MSRFYFADLALCLYATVVMYKTTSIPFAWAALAIASVCAFSVLMNVMKEIRK